MYNTYKNLIMVAEMYEGEETNCELAIKYQKSEDPLYLAVIYCRYFPYITRTAGRYFFLTDADKGSFALEELHKSMMDYKIDGGAKVQTLFIRYYNNRLRTETQALNLQKRIANNNCEDFEETAELFNGYLDNALNITELDLTVDQISSFTENERMYCKIIIRSDNVKDSDIAHQLGISSSAVFQMKRRIAKKIEEYGLGLSMN